MTKINFSSHNVKQIRSMKNYNVNEFLDKLRGLNWYKVINEENVNIAWQYFCEMFLNVIDSIAPIKTVRLKQNSKSWFSMEILEMISKRDKAWVKFRKNKNENLHEEYKRLRSKCQALIKNAKKAFVKSEIEEHTNDPKSLWKTLKFLGMPSKSKGSRMNIGLKNDKGETCFDSKFVSERFNDFFCSIANTLVKKLPKRNLDVSKVFSFYSNKGVIQNAFKLAVVSEEVVETLLKGLNVSKSTGCDNISAKFLKDAASVIATPLTYIINLSLQTGMVPTEFKTARVVPLFKKGDRDYEGNYRPASILPLVSQLLEKVVHMQIYDYLYDKNIFMNFSQAFELVILQILH